LPDVFARRDCSCLIIDLGLVAALNIASHRRGSPESRPRSTSDLRDLRYLNDVPKCCERTPRTRHIVEQIHWSPVASARLSMTSGNEARQTVTARQHDGDTRMTIEDTRAHFIASMRRDETTRRWRVWHHSVVMLRVT
jgi:hypothetical protein